jgi:hypothetical protein
MAIITTESFDWYNDDVLPRYMPTGWTQENDYYWELTTGRHTSDGFNNYDTGPGGGGKPALTDGSSVIGYSFSDLEDDCIIFGAAVKKTSSPQNHIYALFNTSYSSTNPVVSFYIESTGALTIYKDGFKSGSVERTMYGGTDGTLLSTTEAVILTSRFVYLEIKVRCGSSGSISIKIDEQEVYSYSGNLSYGDNLFDKVIIHGGIVFDDLYLLNEQGSRNNDFLGDVTIETMKITGAGSSTQFTPTAGANWEAASGELESSIYYPKSPDVAKYVSTSTVDNADLYTIRDLDQVSPYTVAGVVIRALPVKSDSGTRKIALLAKVDGNTSQGDDFTVITEPADLDDYVPWVQMNLDADPADTDWTIAKVNSMEIGFKNR